MAVSRAFPLLVLTFFAGVAVAADWPREVQTGDATIVLYQPQFDALEGIDTRARIAVAIQRPSVAPEFGALWVAATLAVDRDQDTARFQTFVVERARFPDATAQEVKELTALIERAAPTWDLSLSLTELRAGLEAEGGAADPGFRNDPPRIIYRDRPALLVSLDGEPRLQAIRDTPYERVVNTPFPIVFEPAARQYWLYGSDLWFTTRDLERGSWSPRDTAPEGIARLFASTAGTTSPAAAGEGVPKDKLRQAEIIVTTSAAELIATDGPPQYRPLVGDEMLYVTNTDSDLFLEVPTKQYYVVLSGRWFRSRSLAGPWDFVDPARVPKAFADVPRKSDKSDVLVHVPGTDEAKDAIMDSMIPQTSAVRRGQAMLQVTYDGTPQFDQIPGTKLLYARNTATQVLKVRDRFYAVDQGVWYVADSAYGPWSIAESRPEEVENIPPSSPAYNVKYVYIYDYTPDVVYVGYLPGYTWAFPYRGSIVYGTGHYYRPWRGPGWYYPRPRTWGFNMHYDPWYGWGYGMSWSAGWASFSWGWGDRWGGWGHGYRGGYRDGYWDGYDSGFWAGQHTGGWFGPGGYRPPHHEPRRGFRPPERTQIGSLPGIGGRPSSRPRPVNNIYARPGTRRDGAPDRRRDVQPLPRPAAQRPNNVYVDREGIPHRRTGDGWQIRENHRWRPAPDLPRPERNASPPRGNGGPNGNVPREDRRNGNPPREDRRDGNAPREDRRRDTQPAYRPSPPVEVQRQDPARERATRPPPSGGWGNRSGPRDGPSLPASNQSRMRTRGSEGAERR